MAATDVDWAAFKSVLGTARTALQNEQWLQARKFAAEAKVIAIYNGASVGAAGTFFTTAMEACSTLIADIEKLQIYAAQTGRRRLIKTGLQNEGRARNFPGSGVRYE